MEAISRCPFWLPPLIFLPVIGYFMYDGFSMMYREEMVVGIFVALGGVIFWTLVEYIIHRFIFHYKPKSEFGKRAVYVFHGVHHEYPDDLGRLVFPISASIPGAIIFLFLFKSIPGVSAAYSSVFYAFFILGYLCYDMIHFATHALNVNNSFFSLIKRNHMSHHFSESESHFGISTGIWDLIFRSRKRESKPS